MEIPTSRWRVKVYELEGTDWVDRGTGYCNGDIHKDGAYINVRNEYDADDVLLNSRVHGDTQYQKQQETLIVWSEPNRNDLALSFQDSKGCAVLCEFLVYVHTELEHNIAILAVTNDGQGDVTELIAGPVTYPPKPALGMCSFIPGGDAPRPP